MRRGLYTELVEWHYYLYLQMGKTEAQSHHVSCRQWVITQPSECDFLDPPLFEAESIVIGYFVWSRANPPDEHQKWWTQGDGAGRVVHSVMESKKQQWVAPVWFCLELLEATLYVCSCELAEGELDFYSKFCKRKVPVVHWSAHKYFVLTAPQSKWWW